ncbi:MAG: hypothetical protein A2076_13875 [Geobacteraceae bacterium GWC2_53_11]|nr:MAG: hypothetical protein A2076_13875 [Geobacteraceae bacterium GWC2_53_11]
MTVFKRGGSMGLTDILAKVTDPYERQARLYPALLAGLPVIVMATVLYGSNSVVTAASTVAASCGGLYLLANIARERGRRLEPILFTSWGGKPTTQLLRHRDRNIEGPTKRRYHAFLSRMINLPFPNKRDEETNPVDADDIYQSAVRWLLNHTRDKSKYKMIFDENIAYGFRRNAYGLKIIGMCMCIATSGWVLISEGIVKVGEESGVNFFPANASTAANISLAVSVVMLMVWISYFTKTTIRNAAFTYAETLLRACDKI